MIRRREFAAIGLGACLPLAARGLQPMQLEFPRDHGAHPALRTEWWYITGYAATPAGREFGFQVTFFRTRVDGTRQMNSKFAARQLVFAHAAVTDLQAGRLLHDQRIAREGFGLAQAHEGDTRVHLRDWSLARDAGGYRARLAARDFGLELACEPTQPILLQGSQGLSRKGPEPRQASYYYSQPQLAVRGSIALAGQRLAVTGRAWLDHEWSEEVMHPEAVGWDWIGMNLDDGAALTAFRLRRADGSALWAGGSLRTAAGASASFAAGEVHFTPVRWWTSPASRASYPVEWRLRTPAGDHLVKARLDAQELDSRASTGAIYWEGLSDLQDTGGRRVGRGYLEMTGYAGRLSL